MSTFLYILSRFTRLSFLFVFLLCLSVFLTSIIYCIILFHVFLSFASTLYSHLFSIHSFMSPSVPILLVPLVSPLYLLLRFFLLLPSSRVFSLLFFVIPLSLSLFTRCFATSLMVKPNVYFILPLPGFLVCPFPSPGLSAPLYLSLPSPVRHLSGECDRCHRRGCHLSFPILISIFLFARSKKRVVTEKAIRFWGQREMCLFHYHYWGGWKRTSGAGLLNICIRSHLATRFGKG